MSDNSSGSVVVFWDTLASRQQPWRLRMRHGGHWWVLRSLSYGTKARAQTAADHWNAEILTKLIQDLGEVQRGRMVRRRCHCICHRQAGVKHVIACCRNGWIETPRRK